MEEKAARNYFLSYGKYIIILVLFLLISYILIYLTYEHVKREMIESLHAKQMILAKQSAKGIEMFFNDHIAVLRSLSKNEHIVVLDETGKKMMREFYSSHSEEVSIVTRIDSKGRIVHPEPYDPKVIRQTVTKIDDFQEVKRTHQIVVSDVFTNRRGLKAIIIHVPVFRRGIFDGSIALLFPFDFIAKRYIEDIRIGQDGYAWIVSRNGTELSCPVPGHVGNSVFDNCRDFPDILAMAEKMARGEQGATTYQFDRIRESIITKTTKQAVFMPIRLGNNFWSIVVATPEDEVMDALQGFRNRLILIAVLFVMGMGFIIYIFFRTQILIEEVEWRRKAEEVLRESEIKFRTIFESFEDIYYQTDLNGLITLISPSVYRLSGWKPEELIGQPATLVYAVPEDRAGLLKALSEHGYVRDYELTLVMRDGSKAMASLAAHLIYDSSGAPAGLAGSLRNITDRKRTEMALRESEDRYRTILNEMEEGYQEVDLAGNFTFLNEAFLRIFGYSRDELMGTNFSLYAADEGIAKKVYDAYNLMYKTGIPIKNHEWDITRKDGARRTLEYFASLLRDSHDRPTGFRGIVRDVTERKQAENALQESQRRLSDIIEFLPDATFVLDKEGRVIAWNRGIETMTGVKKEEMIGRGNYEYALPFYRERRPILIDLALHPDREMEKQYTAVQRVGDILFGEAYTPNLPPGDIHLSATASVLRDSKGVIVAAIECIRDNTERKRLEERLQRSEKMESLGTLAGGVAHDLNNVLGVLVGYSELLAEKLPEGNPLRKYADNILQSSIRGAAIIQDLLTLARRGVTVSEVVDLNRVISDYLRTPEFENLKFHHPQVKIWTELEAGLLSIKGSPIHLGKTIMNLLSNAAEAVTGRGEVTIRTENRYLDQPIQGYDEMQEGDYAVLTVSDTGGGISASDLGKIFEPFYTKKVMGRSGTGLGLAVVWGTVKDHNGAIDVQSEEGKGSTFTLYFPVTREESAITERTVSPEEYKGQGESILVVDDVQVQRDLARSMLERLGYEVAAVASGEAAIAYLKDKQADLLVLDMIMDPGMDGMETYRRIIEMNPKQKAVIVSGFSETDRVRKAQELGAGAFVRKPYILEKIGLAVRKELDRK